MMDSRQQSQRTISLASEQNWDTKKCQFCLYKDLIFQQLERLKQAVIIKNQRIKDLEQFIKKISKMAFFDSVPLNSNNINDSIQSSLQAIQKYSNVCNQSNRNDYKSGKEVLLQTRFNDSSEISFRNSKQNTINFQNKIPTFQNKKNSNISHIRSQKENQLLQELKKQQLSAIKIEIDKKYGSGHSGHSRHVGHSSIQNQAFAKNNQKNFDSYREYSQPQEEGPIASIREAPQEAEQTFKNINHKERLTRNQSSKSQFSIKQINSANSGKQHIDKDALSMIKEFAKKLI